MNPQDFDPQQRNSILDGNIQKAIKNSITFFIALMIPGIEPKAIAKIDYLSEVVQRSSELNLDAVVLVTFNNGDSIVFHLESQTRNQAHFVVRMLEYRVAIRKRLGNQIPIFQLGIYIGEQPLTMSNVYEEYEPNILPLQRGQEGEQAGEQEQQQSKCVLRYEVPVIDIRSLDAQTFLKSGDPYCIVMSFLMFDTLDEAVCIEIIEHLMSLGLSKEDLHSHIRDLYEIALVRSARGIIHNIIMTNLILDLDPEVIANDILYKKGVEEGKEEGAVENSKALARMNIIERGISVEETAKFLNVSTDQILEWLEEKAE